MRISFDIASPLMARAVIGGAPAGHGATDGPAASGTTLAFLPVWEQKSGRVVFFTGFEGDHFLEKATHVHEQCLHLVRAEVLDPTLGMNGGAKQNLVGIEI